jgi:hypothetical protein
MAETIHDRLRAETEQVWGSPNGDETLFVEEAPYSPYVLEHLETPFFSTQRKVLGLELVVLGELVRSATLSEEQYQKHRKIRFLQKRLTDNGIVTRQEVDAAVGKGERLPIIDWVPKCQPLGRLETITAKAREQGKTIAIVPGKFVRPHYEHARLCKIASEAADIVIVCFAPLDAAMPGVSEEVRQFMKLQYMRKMQLGSLPTVHYETDLPLVHPSADAYFDLYRRLHINFLVTTDDHPLLKIWDEEKRMAALGGSVIKKRAQGYYSSTFLINESAEPANSQLPTTYAEVFELAQYFDKLARRELRERRRQQGSAV